VELYACFPIHIHGGALFLPVLSASLFILCFAIRTSSVVQRWATGWMMGVRVPAGVRNFSLHHRVQNGSGAHPDSYPVVSGGLKRPEREADHSHLVPRSKNAWSYTCTSPIRLHGVVLS
jgi:hypothetical protein